MARHKIKLNYLFVFIFIANVIYGLDSSNEISQIDEELGKAYGGIFKNKW